MKTKLDIKVDLEVDCDHFLSVPITLVHQFSDTANIFRNNYYETICWKPHRLYSH